jgi:hypothetical protein
MCFAALVAVPSAEAQVTATAVLKSGQRHTGKNLSYRIDLKQVILRESLAEEPRIPVDQVAYVDFGGTPDPSNLNLSGSQEAVVMRNGTVHRGQIIQLGHADASDLSTPFLVIYKDEGGQERRITHEGVARVYFVGGGQAAGQSGGNSVTPPAAGQPFTVSSQQQWLPTGLMVNRGEIFIVRATGQITVGGDGNPTASPAGTGKTDGANPLPNLSTGALIGRIGDGQPFAIGTQTRIPASANGQLFLGVNDSHLEDNRGNFQVEVRQGGRRR